MNTPVFTPSGEALTDGMVHPERPYVLSINSDSETGLRAAELSPPGVSRYTYPMLATCDAEYRAAIESGLHAIVANFYNDTRNGPHSWELLNRLIAMRARFTSSLGRGALTQMARVLAWAETNGFAVEQVTGGKDYPAADISAMLEAEAAADATANETSELPAERVDTSDVRRHGSGAETVYAYGYACIPDRLKVGSTVGGSVDRIAQQISTSTPDKPKLLLEVKTSDCRALEDVLHGILKLRGCKIDGGGAEWFRATRDDIENILRSLALI
jgi:hypothetical protein